MSANTVTVRREMREVKTVVTQKQHMIVLEMSPQDARVLLCAAGNVFGTGTAREVMDQVYFALMKHGVSSAKCFEGSLRVR